LQEYEDGNRPWNQIRIDKIDNQNIQQYDGGKKPWDSIKIENIQKIKAYVLTEKLIELIDKLRSNKKIRNDDVTLISITLES
jgi:transposase-like protein